MKSGQIKIDPDNREVFNNNIDHCVGTGRLGLALTQEYLDELEYVQKLIGFSFIRGHGLFSDDVSIYHEYEENIKKFKNNKRWKDWC